MYLPPEVLQKVKLLEINTRKLVNNIFAGEYHTAFKGQGMTFSDFREYVAGDDVRTISWSLTARTGKTYVKTFEEERELTLMLVVDISGSHDFGSQKLMKGEALIQLAGLLGFAATKNNDQVGLLLFSDRIEHYVSPKKGRGHILRILRDLYFFKPQSRKTNIEVALKYLQGILKKKASVFIFSDFEDQNYESSLKQLGKKHDVVACVVKDSLEVNFPDLGLIEVYDPELDQVSLVDTSSAFFRDQFQEELRLDQELRERALRKSQVQKLEINSSQDFITPLIAFFKRRNR